MRGGRRSGYRQFPGIVKDKRLSGKVEARNIFVREELFSGGDGNVIGEFELRENFLAAGTNGDMRLPCGKLLERKLSFVIGSESFGIGTRGSLCAGLCAEAQLSRECLFKAPIAVVKRHGEFHP